MTTLLQRRAIRHTVLWEGIRTTHKEDAGLELNISKTAILPKDITQEPIIDVAHGMINATPKLTQLRGEVSLDSFRPDDFVGIGVPIVTDTFVRQFVDKTCRDIIEDVEKLDLLRMVSSISNE